MALHAVFPEYDLDDENGSTVGRLSYPRPISEPPSPTSSRATTPIPSDDDEVDEEREVILLKCIQVLFQILMFKIFPFAHSLRN